MIFKLDRRTIFIICLLARIAVKRKVYLALNYFYVIGLKGLNGLLRTNFGGFEMFHLIKQLFKKNLRQYCSK